MQHRYFLYCLLVLTSLLIIPQGGWATTPYHTETSLTQVVPNSQDTVDLNGGVAMLEEDQPKVALYPNPSSGPVTLLVKEDRWQGGTVSVYNIIGQLITEKPIDRAEIQLDLSGQSQGIYLVTLRNQGAHKTLRLERSM